MVLPSGYILYGSLNRITTDGSVPADAILKESGNVTGAEGPSTVLCARH
jgi:hypothetical protein